MARMNWNRTCAVVVLAGLAALAIGLVAFGTAEAYGQFISNSPRNGSVVKTDAVQYLFPEQVSVPVGKASPVALHFRVAQGLHINSHTPIDEFLIPTTFSIPDGMGVRLDAATYPAGSHHFPRLRSQNQGERIHRRVHDSRAHRGHAGQSPGRGQAALPGLRPESVHAAQDDRRAD